MPAAARGARPGRLCVGYGVLLRRAGSESHALVVLLPHPERIREARFGLRRSSTAEKEMADMFGTVSTDEAGWVGSLRLRRSNNTMAEGSDYWRLTHERDVSVRSGRRVANILRRPATRLSFRCGCVAGGGDQPLLT